MQYVAVFRARQASISHRRTIKACSVGCRHGDGLALFCDGEIHWEPVQLWRFFRTSSLLAELPTGRYFNWALGGMDTCSGNPHAETRPRQSKGLRVIGS